MLPPHVEPSFRTLVGALAGPDPLPAGGAAGVVAIAMGTGLGAKVARLSSSDQPALAPLGEGLQRILDRLLPEFAADCRSFANVLEALRQPRDKAERAESVRTAWSEATARPVAVANAAHQAEALLSQCSGKVKQSMAGDLKAALELVRAGRRIAESNARENAQRLAPEDARRLLAPLEHLLD